MIINNLEYVEDANQVQEVKGGIASVLFNFEILALGANSSESITTFELLSTSDSGTNISGASGTFAAIAS